MAVISQSVHLPVPLKLQYFLQPYPVTVSYKFEEMSLSELERITLLMMRGWGDNLRPFAEVTHLLNATFPDRAPISKSTAQYTVARFVDTGSVKDRARSRRPNESTFMLNGHVNRHNCRYWDNVNPHWMSECHTQHPQKLNEWAVIVHNSIIGQFFIDGNLNANMYHDTLQNEIVPALQATLGADFQTCISNKTEHRHTMVFR
ncbi:hypothetical protein J6590_074626 [Homalodisca vitripennis]|nr:hypothetical protein J6590_074626 [Homalodisca vitripennis]